MTTKSANTNDRKGIIAPVVACIGMALIVVMPFFYIGEDQSKGCCGGEMPMTHDAAMHHNQMSNFKRGLSAGRLYPRWEDATHFGYGAPTTSFYPPGVYYVTSIIYFTVRDWRLTLMGLHLFLMAASGFAVYYYARQFLLRRAAMVSMVVYILAPYHLINQYQRGALAEQSAFIWAPLALLFVDKLLFREIRSKENLVRSFCGLSASFGAWLWFHPPTAYQFLLIFGLVVGFRFIISFRRNFIRVLNRSAVVISGLIFGSFLAAAYFYPALLERDLVYSEDVEKSWPYHASYIYYLAQNIYGHGQGGFFWRLDRIWLFNTASIVLMGMLLIILSRRDDSMKIRPVVILWLGAGLLASFLMTRLSYPLGRLIPGIETGVFSWRMLTFASLVVALLTGFCRQVAGTLIGQGSLRSGVLTGAAAVGVLVLMSWVSFDYVIRPMYRAQAFKPVPSHYNYATLPRGVPRELPGIERVQTSSGLGEVVVEVWDPEYRRVKVNLPAPDRVLFRTSYFPGWVAEVNGEIHKIGKDEYGSIMLNLPSGDHDIILEFQNTRIRRLAGLITVISIAIFGFLLFVAFKPSKPSPEDIHAQFH